MGRSAKENCRPNQVVDGGGDVNQSKVDYGDDDGNEGITAEGMLKGAATFFMQKEIAGEFGEGIGKGIGSDDSSGDDE